MFKFNKNYNDLDQVKDFYPDFLTIYNGLKEKGEYPYNARFEGKIRGIEGDDEKTAIYLLQHLRDKKEKEELDKKMLLDGWVKLTEDIVKEAIEKKKKIQLSAKTTNDWATFKIDKVLKPHCFNGQYGLMELRARTRGYSLQQFEDAYCKLI